MVSSLLKNSLSLVAFLVLVVLVSACGSTESAELDLQKRPTEIQGSCTVVDNVVHGVGLPNWTLMNFMIYESDGSEWGWVLGQTDNGTWNVTVPERSGDTTYKFISRQKAKDGKRYDVFASCSAGV